MKKIVSVLLAVVLVVCLFVMPASADMGFTGYGDTNGDGYVTSADAIYLLRYTILPDRYPLNGAWFDYNHDGIVTSDDAVYLLYHAMLPEKYPLVEG